MLTTRSDPDSGPTLVSSNGRRIVTPRLRSGPAPSVAAAMMPGPAPVTTIQPASASRPARSRAWTYSGSVVRVRAEPNTVTLRTSAYGSEQPVGGAHLLQGVAGDLEVEPVGAVGAEVVDGAVDVGEDVAVAGGACLVQQALDDVSFHVGFSLPCSGRGSDPVHVRTVRCHRPTRQPDGLPEGWSLSSSDRGVDRLCAACTRENVRSIEARLDEEWW